MFRQEKRFGLARVGTIELKGKRLKTPTIIDYMDRSNILDLIDFGKAPRVLEILDEDKFRVLGSKDENVVVLTGLSTLKPKELVEFIYRLRMSTHKPIYAVAIATPLNLPLLYYMGIDLFDNIVAILKAYQGIYMTEFGEFEFDRPVCNCPVCLKGDFSHEGLARHNTFVMNRVLNLMVREDLRNLVEAWVKFDPELDAMLRFFDRLNCEFPRFNRYKVIMTTEHSFTRPEVTYFLKRSSECYEPKGKGLIILPCSARKPYLKSRSHSKIRMFVGDVCKRGFEEIIVSSPLVVPRVFELVYPALNYDVTVTGDWSLDEINFVSSHLSKFIDKNFELIVGHVTGGYRKVVEKTSDLLGFDVVWTAEKDVTSIESLKNLKRVLDKFEFEGFDLKRSIFEHMMRYQFDVEFEVENVRGKYPNLEFYGNGRVARVDTNYGCLDIDLSIARYLIERSVYYVEIENFKPKGTIFAVGVRDADKRIRPNDIVAFYNDEYLGVGRALMFGEEMVKNDGKAVDVKKVGAR